MQIVDLVIVGAGIAGASLAAEIADKMSVVVLEREDQPGYHATGRSAAIYTETYGNQTIRAITSAGRAFFANPPEGFSEAPLWKERGVLFVGREDQRQTLKNHAEESSKLVETVHSVSGEKAHKMVPVLNNTIVAGVSEPEAMELDVDAIHNGFLRQLKRRGGELVCKAEVTALEFEGDRWRVETTVGQWAAKVVVNAAGAWVDGIAEMAGVEPVGAKPLRRTAVIFPNDSGQDAESWPFVIDADEAFYFRPEAGKLMGSPSDETLSEPCDAQPEELDVAIAVDRIQKATNLEIRSIDHKWAGLRTFVEDKTLVVGFEPDHPGFFWLAGQGGYGIQTSPAIARIAAGLILRGAIPTDIEERGVRAEDLSPARFR